MIIRQALEQHMEGKVSPWILESPMTTSKMESLSALTATMSRSLTVDFILFPLFILFYFTLLFFSFFYF